MAVACACACATAFAASPARASCFDGVRNGPESDVDCGGDCPACERGDYCRLPSDCYSGRCAESICEERTYLKGEPLPRGYRVEASDSDGAAITRTIGWVSLGAGYGAAYGAALVATGGELSWLLAPVVGPWIKVARSEDQEPARPHPRWTLAFPDRRSCSRHRRHHRERPSTRTRRAAACAQIGVAPAHRRQRRRRRGGSTACFEPSVPLERELHVDAAVVGAEVAALVDPVEVRCS